MPTPSSTPFVRQPVAADGCRLPADFRESALAAGPVVGKEYVRPTVAFLTNELARFEPVTGCDHRGGR
jgi:hypothetical protein